MPVKLRSVFGGLRIRPGAEGILAQHTRHEGWECGVRTVEDPRCSANSVLARKRSHDADFPDVLGEMCLPGFDFQRHNTFANGTHIRPFGDEREASFGQAAALDSADWSASIAAAVL